MTCSAVESPKETSNAHMQPPSNTTSKCTSMIYAQVTGCKPISAKIYGLPHGF